jgi:hypothetical protein
MSLERTALRLASLLALTDSGDGSGGSPTLAGKRWYDSLMEPEHQFGGDRPVPLGVVYTDEDAGPNKAQAGTGLVFDRTVALTLELICATTLKTPDGVEIGMPQTDAELEAVLDLLEYQCIAALTNPASSWALLWGRLTRGILEVSSTRVMDSKGETRMAARTVTLMVRLPLSCPVAVVALSSGETPPEPGGIADLPAPLRVVAEAVAAATDGQAKTVRDVVAYLMSAGVPTTALLPVLATVGVGAFAGETEDGTVGAVDAPIEGLDQ